MASIHERFDELNDKLSEMAKMVAVMGERVETMRTQTVVPQLNDHGKRLRVLEQWRWWQMGAAAAVGAVSPQLAAFAKALVGL